MSRRLRQLLWPAATAWFDLRMLHVFVQPHGSPKAVALLMIHRAFVCCSAPSADPNQTSIMYIQ
jgi:hypothetical protein